MHQALVFPGQGAQYVGMAGELAAASPAAAAVLRQADEVLGLSLSTMMAEGPVERLTRTDISQPAILVASWMAYQAVVERHGVPPAMAAGGLSLGEYSALLVAGAFTFPDALRLVRLRGEAMQAAAEASDGGMVALIGADEATAEALCAAVRGDELLQIANLNATGQIVISGAAAACARAVAKGREHGIRRAMPLPVAGAFHSPLMAPAAERLATALADTPVAEPRYPVYANVDAAPVTATTIRECLVRQLTDTVRWADCLRAMQAAGATRFLELGPGATISGMITRTLGTEVTVTKVDQKADLDSLQSTSNNL